MMKFDKSFIEIKIPDHIIDEFNEKFIEQFNAVCNSSGNSIERMGMVVSLLNEYRKMQAKIIDFNYRTVSFSPSFLQDVDMKCFHEIQNAVSVFNTEVNDG